jgi:hypothetical protein
MLCMAKKRTEEIVRVGGETFLSPRALADRWNGLVSLRTIEAWRYSELRGAGKPIHYRHAGRILYPLSDVRRYERENPIFAGLCEPAETE